MNLTKTLAKYFYKKYITTLLYSLVISIVFVFIIDTAELSRRISKTGDGDIILAIKLAFFKLPEMVFEIFPFIILFGSLVTFYNMAKSSELVIFRSSGVSIWKILTPPLLVVSIIGLFLIFVLQPFIAFTSAKFKELEARSIRGQVSLITLSENGLWLKEENLENNTYYIIHSLGMDKKYGNIENVIFFNYQENGNLLRRIDADNAQLSRGKWSLSNAWIKETEETVYYEKFSINTNLTIDQIQENFSPPETISFWKLPSFIAIAEEAGFASQRHKTRFFNLIVFPFFLIAMVLASAPFSINYIRTSRTNILIFGGIITGLVVYTLSSVSLAFGSSGAINPLLSAIITPIIAITGSVTILLYTEES
ncbi:MAG: LPS export ABC transporter permease LptG [Alphaproteobacteria bacterium]